jgi:hypothetical protein
VVTVPAPPERVSFLRIDENLNGRVDVPRDAVLARRYVWVRAAARRYEVTGYDPSRQAVWQPELTDPLGADAPNVFRAGANGRLQLLPDEPLVKGATYLTVSRPAVWTPPPGGLSRPAAAFPLCDPRQEWLGHLVHLPHDAGPDVAAWCARVCRRPLIDVPPELSLVLPPAIAVHPDGAYRVAAGEEVVLALQGGDWLDPVVEVVREETGRTNEWHLKVASGDFISLGKLPPGAYTVHVRDWEWVSVRVEVAAPGTPEVPAVLLRTGAPEGGEETRTPLLDPSAGERFGALLAGWEAFRGIELPDGWPVSLSWRSAGGEETAPGLDTAEAFAAALAGCVAADPAAATFDAGVFGTISWKKPTAEPAPALPAALPAALLTRLRWLDLARSQAPAGPTAPLGGAVPSSWAERLAEPDRPLVAGFLAVGDWPLALIAHARAAGRELSVLLRSSP